MLIPATPDRGLGLSEIVIGTVPFAGGSAVLLQHLQRRTLLDLNQELVKLLVAQPAQITVRVLQVEMDRPYDPYIADSFISPYRECSGDLDLVMPLRTGAGALRSSPMHYWLSAAHYLAGSLMFPARPSRNSSPRRSRYSCASPRPINRDRSPTPSRHRKPRGSRLDPSATSDCFGTPTTANDLLPTIRSPS